MRLCDVREPATTIRPASLLRIRAYMRLPNQGGPA